MKGGVASGVVYPPAILALKETYRFRNIGGTSAGAIAAALAAAAEYGRTVMRPDPDEPGREIDGFERLQRVSDQILQEGFLRRLFEPAPETRPLMQVLFALRGEPRLPSPPRRLQFLPRLVQKVTGTKWINALFRAVWFVGVLLRYLPAHFLLGAVLGALTWYLLLLAATWSRETGGLWEMLRAPLSSLAGTGLVPLVLFALLGGAIGGILRLKSLLLKTVPKYGFGVCVGHREGEEKHQPADTKRWVLTDWIAWSLDYVAGKRSWDGDHLDAQGNLVPKGGDFHPLTFGDLEAAEIKLRMVTTNVSQGQPYALPFEEGDFLFKIDEIAALFPGDIVTQMKKHVAVGSSAVIPNSKQTGFYELPAKENLPVAVATRMSLSFPVLISAVPLYTVSATVIEETEGGEKRQLTRENAPQLLQRNWFSDGGLSSNFPIHFFDAWLPASPTFGINLVPRPDRAFVNEDTLRADRRSAPVKQSAYIDGKLRRSRSDLTAAVYLPRADDLPAPEWQPIGSLIGFLKAALSTAKDHRDTLQSILPSYRERIVQIRLKQTEGGLNLDMPGTVLRQVVSKGRQAGEELLSFRMEEHQWVRYRVLMAQLERQLHTMRTKEGAFKVDYRVLGKRQLTEEFPFRRIDPPWIDATEKIMSALERLLNEWKAEYYSVEPPEPEPILRVTPNL
jgi:predicted acylesterase/phospholipase RssA